LKSGMSLDAKIAPAQGTSQWITSESSRKEGHRLRAQVDAILVGSKTVKKDNPELTVRLAKGHSPIRVILDQELNLSLKRKIFLTCSQAPVWVIASKKMKDSPQHCLLLRKKIDVLFCAVNAQGQFDLEDLLSQLGSREITSLQLEGGARLYSSFIETKQVDELHLFVAPKLLGGQGLDLLQNYSGKTLQQAMHFTLYEVKRVGTDLELVYISV
ncbi:MAG: bifunctional diaminohydroxyphosphoribosylaminopyrimidine deaminase/5-amino-6-(5-phosphoribosylamino)uracil reductase RibD, partial [Deltaproteobacteria bacterium]|nr:bifunctional diaminohydroxyphosphoribosylaminopyrimidine deaminase/5-amino-6-(5-phosphoribosylamino)uracil reductase RibD [Deltaproteobacteria bacterium]